MENDSDRIEDLFQPHIWSSKLRAEGKSDLDEREIKKLRKRKMLEYRENLDKMKKRRLEVVNDSTQRDKEDEFYRKWEKQEDAFHLRQAKLRSEIRIRNGTAKPIDLLAHYIGSEDDDMIAEVAEPYAFLDGLKICDLEDLMEDIKVYLELEQGKNADYWRDITIVAEDELEKLKRSDPNCPKHFSNRNPIRSNPTVRESVEATFKNSSVSDLYVLEKGIKEKLRGGEGIDVGHWEDMLDQLKAHMARRRLNERHREQLKNKLHRLKREQCIETGPLFPAGAREERGAAGEPFRSPRANVQNEDPLSSGTKGNLEKDPDGHSEDEEEDPCVKEYDRGGYCPALLRAGDLPPGFTVLDLEEDLGRLEFARKSVLATGQSERGDEEEFMRRARAGMDADEAQFSVEVPLNSEASVWSDKYKPRKPRFFNRVHTGFEWNKYNQTHYDLDNPPPKVVQGYKFNIFYPDLIDKAKIPRYKVVQGEDKNFATIRFIAGAPYEDIAFKIVSREWEKSHRRGFRCQFQNNILQLWFHFSRMRYRR